MTEAYQPIRVFSTYANDILIPDVGEMERRPGGPMLFIERALADAGVPFTVVPGVELDVEISMSGGVERGRVLQEIVPRSIGSASLSDWAIVSTICGEWTLPPAGPLPPKLFVDLQGFVREGGEGFGQKKPWDLSRELARQIFCIKGTLEEVACLPEVVCEDQKGRLLICTNGKAGADVFYRGEKQSFKPAVVENPVDTIGAGDTFLAYLVAAIYQGAKPFVAAQRATELTTQFLRQKQRQTEKYV